MADLERERSYAYEGEIRQITNPEQRHFHAKHYADWSLLPDIAKDCFEAQSEGYTAFRNLAIYHAYNGRAMNVTASLYERRFRGRTREEIIEDYCGRLLARWENEYGEKADELVIGMLRRKIVGIFDGTITDLGALVNAQPNPAIVP